MRSNHRLHVRAGRLQAGDESPHDVQNAIRAPESPRPAATVMLVRDEMDGISVYLTRRSKRSRFVPDAYVFPGGAVEAQDEDPATPLFPQQPPGAVPTAVLVAALRELFEEAGILLVRDGELLRTALAPVDVAIMRRELAAGASFSTLLAARNLRLDAGDLVHYSNWITPPTRELRFDTHFFIARAPADQMASADAAEVEDGTWITPAQALARARRDEMEIVFPTRKHLERLARFADVATLLAHARDRRVVAVHPRERGSEVVLEGGDQW